MSLVSVISPPCPSICGTLMVRALTASTVPFERTTRRSRSNRTLTFFNGALGWTVVKIGAVLASHPKRMRAAPTTATQVRLEAGWFNRMEHPKTGADRNIRRRTGLVCWVDADNSESITEIVTG